MGPNGRVFIDRAPSMRVKHEIVHIPINEAVLMVEFTMSLECLRDVVDIGQRVLARYARGERDILEEH